MSSRLNDEPDLTRNVALCLSNKRPCRLRTSIVPTDICRTNSVTCKMVFASQIFLTLFIAASTHRAYRAFQRRVPKVAKTRRAGTRVNKTQRVPRAIRKTGLPNTRPQTIPKRSRSDAPSFLSEKTNHAAHDSACMTTHLTSAIQLQQYIKNRESDLQDEWDAIGSVQKQIGYRDGGIRVCQQSRLPVLTRQLARLLKEQSESERFIRECYETKTSLESEIARARTLIDVTLDQAFEAADFYYSRPREEDDHLSPFRYEDFEGRLAALRFNGGQLRSARLEVRTPSYKMRHLLRRGRRDSMERMMLLMEEFRFLTVI